MPSTSLKTRLKALETAQLASDDDAYWTWVRENVDTHVDMFGRAVKGEITTAEWNEWQDAHPWPEFPRPYTPEEERENERAREEFERKIKETRERLWRGAEMGLFDNNHQPMKRGSHATDNASVQDRERPNEPAAEQPTPSPPIHSDSGSQPAPRHRPRDADDAEPDGPTKAARRKWARLERLAHQ